MADPLNVLAIDVKRITKLEVAPLIAAERAIIDKLNNIDAAKWRYHPGSRKKVEAEDADNVETNN